MAIDGIAIVTKGLRYSNGSFADRLVSDGLIGAFGYTFALLQVIKRVRRRLMTLTM